MISHKNIEEIYHHVEDLSDDDFQEYCMAIRQDNDALLTYCEEVLESEDVGEVEYLVDFYLTLIINILQENGIGFKNITDEQVDSYEESFLSFLEEVETDGDLESRIEQKDLLGLVIALIENEEEVNDQERELMFSLMLFIIYLGQTHKA
jgi:hypothetical protein